MKSLKADGFWTNASPKIYVLFNDGGLGVYDETWTEDQPASDPANARIKMRTSGCAF